MNTSSRAKHESYLAFDLVEFLLGRAHDIQKIGHISSGISGCCDEDLSLNLLQPVQALMHESYLAYDLVEFLLGRALGNQKIGHTSSGNSVMKTYRCIYTPAGLSAQA